MPPWNGGRSAATERQERQTEAPGGLTGPGPSAGGFCFIAAPSISLRRATAFSASEDGRLSSFPRGLRRQTWWSSGSSISGPTVSGESQAKSQVLRRNSRKRMVGAQQSSARREHAG
jgi:hypothetical protein